MMKKRLLAALACLAVLVLLAACGGGPGGEKSFTLRVIHGDGSEKTFQVTTKKDTVGEALVEAELIAGEAGPYGLYVTTVDGESADQAKEQWWCMTKSGDSVNTGVDSTQVEDGATYEFTFTEGY